MLKYLEIYFIDLAKGKQRGPGAWLLRMLMRVLSWLYQIAIGCRNWAYDRGWLKRYTPPVPVVISVGNIVAGGTGKTPVTLMLAKEFYQQVPLAILSRGYRSAAEKLSNPIILSRGQGPMHPASYCGDEPFMLSQNLPKAFVFVGKDRHKSSLMAARAGAQLILLDDGMQHRRLARDFEVVVMDACDPFGQGYFLPRGFLREGLKALSRADLIVLNHVHDRERFLATRKKIARYTTAPVVATKIEVEAVLDLQGYPVESLKNKRVGVFCGIAHPDYFENTVLSLGAYIVASYPIADHVDYDPEALATFAINCREQGAEYLVCTEKDRVKLVDSLELAIPVIWVRMKLAFVEGKSLWDQFIEQAKNDLNRQL